MAASFLKKKKNYKESLQTLNSHLPRAISALTKHKNGSHHQDWGRTPEFQLLL